MFILLPIRQSVASERIPQRLRLDISRACYAAILALFTQHPLYHARESSNVSLFTEIQGASTNSYDPVEETGLKEQSDLF